MFAFGIVGTLSPGLASWALFSIIGFILIFEFCTKLLEFCLEESPIYGKMVQTIYKELMQMGIASFSILLYECLVPNEELVTAHEWLQCIEFAHIVLFFLAIFLVTHSFFLMGVSIYSSKTFIQYFRSSYETILHSLTHLSALNKLIYHYAPFSELRQKVEFKIMHSLFRDIYRPLPYDFDFSLYIQKCFQHYALRTTEVSIYSWLVVVVVIMANYFRAEYHGPFSCGHHSVLEINRELLAMSKSNNLISIQAEASSEGEDHVVMEKECSFEYTYLFFLMGMLIVLFVMILAVFARVYINRLIRRAGVANVTEYRTFIEFCEEDVKAHTAIKNRKRTNSSKAAPPAVLRDELARSEPFRWSATTAMAEIDNYFEENEHFEEDKVLYAWITKTFSWLCEFSMFQLYSFIALLKSFVQQAQTTHEMQLRSHGGDLLNSPAAVSMPENTSTLSTDNQEISYSRRLPGEQGVHSPRSNSIFSNSSRSASIQINSHRSFRLSMASMKRPNPTASKVAPDPNPSTSKSASLKLDVATVMASSGRTVAGVVQTGTDFVMQATQKLVHPKENDSRVAERAPSARQAKEPATTSEGRRKSFLACVEHDFAKNTESDIKKMLSEGKIRGESEDEGKVGAKSLATGLKSRGTATLGASADQAGGVDRSRGHSIHDDEASENVQSDAGEDDDSSVVYTTMTARYIESLPVPLAEEIHSNTLFSRIISYFPLHRKSSSVRPQLEDGSLSDNFDDIFYFKNAVHFFRAVEIAIMLNSFYMSMWITNFITFVHEFGLHRDLFQVCLVAPIIICFYFIGQLAKTCAILDGMTSVSRHYAKIREVIEEMEDMNLLVSELRNKILSKINHLEFPHVGLCEIFYAVDIDRSGSIDKIEFRSMLRKLKLRYSDARFNRLFRAIDKDMTSIITLENFGTIIFPDLTLSQLESFVVDDVKEIENAEKSDDKEYATADVRSSSN